MLCDSAADFASLFKEISGDRSLSIEENVLIHTAQGRLITSQWQKMMSVCCLVCTHTHMHKHTSYKQIGAEATDESPSNSRLAFKHQINQSFNPRVISPAAQMCKMSLGFISFFIMLLSCTHTVTFMHTHTHIYTNTKTKGMKINK